MKYYQRFEIRGSSLIEHWFDSELIDGMFILSDKNEKGQPAAIVHQMKFYNRLSWESSFDINVRYPGLNF
jgi:beta-lactamase class D